MDSRSQAVPWPPGNSIGEVEAGEEEEAEQDPEAEEISLHAASLLHILNLSFRREEDAYGRGEGHAGGRHASVLHLSTPNTPKKFAFEYCFRGVYFRYPF